MAPMLSSPSGRLGGSLAARLTSRTVILTLQSICLFSRKSFRVQTPTHMLISLDREQRHRYQTSTRGRYTHDSHSFRGVTMIFALVRGVSAAVLAVT